MKKIIAILTVFMLTISLQACSVADNGNREIIGKAYIGVDINTIIDNYDMLDEGLKNDVFVPKSGYILDNVTVDIIDGDTVLTVLELALNERNILLDYTKSSSLNTVYIKGINHIYPGSCGSSSGWLFSVNGSFPTLSCDSIIVNDGDEIIFFYSVKPGDIM